MYEPMADAWGCAGLQSKLLTAAGIPITAGSLNDALRTEKGASHGRRSAPKPAASSSKPAGAALSSPAAVTGEKNEWALAAPAVLTAFLCSDGEESVHLSSTDGENSAAVPVRRGLRAAPGRRRYQSATVVRLHESHDSRHSPPCLVCSADAPLTCSRRVSISTTSSSGASTATAAALHEEGLAAGAAGQALIQVEQQAACAQPAAAEQQAVQDAFQAVIRQMAQQASKAAARQAALAAWRVSAANHPETCCTAAVQRADSAIFRLRPRHLARTCWSTPTVLLPSAGLGPLGKPPSA